MPISTFSFPVLYICYLCFACFQHVLTELPVFLLRFTRVAFVFPKWGFRGRKWEYNVTNLSGTLYPIGYI